MIKPGRTTLDRRAAPAARPWCKPHVWISESRIIQSYPYSNTRRSPAVVVSSASSASSDTSALAWHPLVDPSPRLNDSCEEDQSRAETAAPLPLPAPPPTSGFTDLLPYLMKLMFGERQLLWRIGLSVGLMFVSKLAGLSSPFFIKQAVDTLTMGAGTVQQATQLLLLPWLPVSATPAVQGALLAVACFGLCDMIKNVTKEAQAPIFLPVSQAVTRRIAYHTFDHVMSLDVPYHLEKRTGKLSRILERGPRSIQQVFRIAVFVLLPTTFELLAVSLVLAKTFSPLVGAMVAVTFTTYISWSIVLTQMAAELRKEVNELDNQTTSKAIDALLNFETVTLFNNRKLEVEQYFSLIRGLQGATNRTEQLSAILNAGQAVILATGMASIMFAAVLFGRSGSGATAGDLVMIQGLLLQLWAPLQFLGWLYRELKNSLVDIEEFMEILRTKSSIIDGSATLPSVAPSLEHAAAATARNGNGADHDGGRHHVVDEHLEEAGRKLLEMTGPSRGSGLEIELKDVVFGYLDNRKILRGVSLRVEPGQSVAIVGPSGSGKSTILKLLTRQYDVTEGRLLLNGCEMKDLTLESLRNAVAVVPQETVLFNDTIMNNIRYGRPSATDQDVLEAAKMARLDVAVARMPKSFDTVVGERGLKLSGGEKQRVAIARAFLRAPRLLICDEATSALDSETEAQIITSLDELAQGRTSIFVAHRLSTVKGCDKIVVLEDGLLIEQGSHEELMRREGGKYRDMWELQAAEEQQHTHTPNPLSAFMSAIMHTADGDMTSDDESVQSGLALRTRA